MSDTKDKQLEIRLVGDDSKFRQMVRKAILSNRVKHLSSSEWDDSLWPSLMKYLLVIEIKSKNQKQEIDFSKLWAELASKSPLFYFSASSQPNNEWLSLFKKSIEELGARVYVGESGKKSLLHFLALTSQRNPSEVITSFKLSDNGLTIAFADHATANIRFDELRRLAETKEIMFNEIRISEDRSYITIGTRGEPVPIPFDVLREFVMTDKPSRERKNLQQRKLTAKNVGERIRQLRDTAKISQEALAAKIGTSRWTIMRIEKGSYLPKVSMLEQIAQALGLELQNFLKA